MMRGKASFFGPDIQALRALIAEERFATPAQASRVEKVDIHDRYVAMVTDGIRLARSDLRVVLDAGNGAGGPLGLACMRKVGLSPDALFCEMDGRFPNHHPDPTMPENLAALIARVRATKARVGLAYDGDADRLGAVDATGEVVWGDKLMILFSRALLAERPGAAILGEVKCSQTLYDDIAKHGGRPIMWKTGHSVIKTKMKEEGALLAGEMNGHLFFADRYPGYDDALYASLRLLEILARDPRSIGEMLADVPQTYATPEIRVDCPDAAKFDVVAAVLAHYRAQGRPVVDIDGARISFGDAKDPSWGLVRASNTGPVLVMRFEATSPERRDAIRAEVEQVVTAARGKRPRLTAAPQAARCFGCALRAVGPPAAGPRSGVPFGLSARLRRDLNVLRAGAAWLSRRPSGRSSPSSAGSWTTSGGAASRARDSTRSCSCRTRWA